MCVGWIVYTVEDYILAWLAWKNHIMAILRFNSFVDKMQQQ